MSDEEHIFDLKSIGKKYDDSALEAPKKSMPHDMDKLLEGYVEVKQADWHNLPRGSHIRYLRKDGQFKPGGYIFSIDVRVENNYEQIYLALSWSKTARFAKFAINLDTIEKIWRSTSIVPVASAGVTSAASGCACQSKLAKLEKDVEQLQIYFEKLKKVVAILERKLRS